MRKDPNRLQLGDYTISVVTWLGVEEDSSERFQAKRLKAVFDAKGDFVIFLSLMMFFGWQSMDQLNYLMVNFKLMMLRLEANKMAEKLAWQKRNGGRLQ